MRHIELALGVNTIQSIEASSVQEDKQSRRLNVSCRLGIEKITVL